MPGKDIATNGIMPLWWNWQTRGTQNPVVAIPCRFDPDQRHHRKDEQDKSCSSFLWCRCQWGRRGKTKTYCYKKTNNLPSFVNLPWQIFAEGHAESGKRQSPTKSLNEQDKSCSSFLWCRCQWGQRGKTKTYCYKKRKNCRRSSICLGKFLPRVHAESGKRQSPTKSLNEQDKSLSVFSVV